MDYFRKGDNSKNSNGAPNTITVMNRLNSIRSHKGLKPVSAFEFALAFSKSSSKSKQPLLEGTANEMRADKSYPEEHLDAPRAGQEIEKPANARTSIRKLERNSEESR